MHDIYEIIAFYKCPRKQYIKVDENAEGAAGMKKTGRGRLCLELFWEMLMLSTFTTGGGFVIVSLMRRKFVEEKHWMDEQEMLDIAAIAQSCPGAIAVNAAILVGWRMAGLAGMLICVLGTILPPFVILTAISVVYNAFAANRYVALFLRGMQIGVSAVIFDVVLQLGKNVVKSKSLLCMAVMALAFVAAYLMKINVVYLLLAAAALGVARALTPEKKEGK